MVGKLFDDRDNRISPTWARKGLKRWRDYVSQAVLQGEKAKAGSIARIPAAEIENRVADALRKIEPRLGSGGHCVRNVFLPPSALKLIRQVPNPRPAFPLRRPLRASCSTMPLVHLIPSAISRANRFAWPTTRLVEESSLPYPRFSRSWLCGPLARAARAAQFDAPAAVAQFRADVAHDRGDLLHCPRGTLTPSPSRLESVG